jgi:hypothetical protein
MLSPHSADVVVIANEAISTSVPSVGIDAALFIPICHLDVAAVVAEPKLKFTFALTSQKPAGSEIDVTVFATPVAQDTAEPVATLDETV